MTPAVYAGFTGGRAWALAASVMMLRYLLLFCRYLIAAVQLGQPT